MNLFWDAFYGILPQMSSNLYKIFTSEAIKLSQKNEFLTLIAFRFTLSWRYIIVVSFISIVFVVVKLKISNVLRTDSASTKWPFLGDFWVLTPPIWSNIAAILTRVSTLANKNTVWKFFEEFEYLWKKEGRKISTLGPTLTPLFLLKMVKIEKNKQYCGKTSAIELSKYVRMKSLSPLPFPGRMWLLFTIFGIIITGNTVGWNQNLTNTISSTRFLVNFL